MLMGSWREPLRLTLNVSTRKKASLPGSPFAVSFFLPQIRSDKKSSIQEQTTPKRKPMYLERRGLPESRLLRKLLHAAHEATLLLCFSTPLRAFRDILEVRAEVHHHGKAILMHDDSC